MKYVCNVCGWIYDEEETGVKWEDLPEDFACELCGVGKEDFTAEEQYETGSAAPGIQCGSPRFFI